MCMHTHYTCVICTSILMKWFVSYMFFFKLLVNLWRNIFWGSEELDQFTKCLQWKYECLCSGPQNQHWGGSHRRILEYLAIVWTNWWTRVSVRDSRKRKKKIQERAGPIVLLLSVLNQYRPDSHFKLQKWKWIDWKWISYVPTKPYELNLDPHNTRKAGHSIISTCKASTLQETR